MIAPTRGAGQRQVLQPVGAEVQPPNCDGEVQPGLQARLLHDELM